MSAIALVGSGMPVPCLDGLDRPYLDFDAAASTSALPAVAERVAAFLPCYSSVHRGAGYKSQVSTAAYEAARAAILAFAGRSPDRDVAIICRNTTEAINHLAYRLRLRPDEVVLTTVVEHHANLLPWARVAARRFVECDAGGTFPLAAVRAELARSPRPRLLAVTGASNVTGWVPPVDDIVALAHEHGVPVLVDAAQLAPHRPLPRAADFIAFSGHKLYAPFGAGALIGPRAAFADGEPFLAGGGAVDLVDLDEVVWARLPDREEAGSPNVIGAVALAAALDELTTLGWERIRAHDDALARAMRDGLAAIPGVRVLGTVTDGLPITTLVVEGVPHALVAARLSAEFGIGVRHGCFCAHPYLTRLLGMRGEALERFHAAARRHDRSHLPGAVRASAGIATSLEDVRRLCAAIEVVATTPPPVPYDADAAGDRRPRGAYAALPQPGRGRTPDDSSAELGEPWRMEVSPPLTRRSGPDYDRATVADAMHDGVFTCDPATPLVNVAQRMAGERVHAIIVMTPGDGGRRPWGVVTDLELIRRAARITETTAGEAAAQNILTVRPGDRLAQVAARLLVRGATHALVVDPDTERPVGVLSTLDVIGVLAGRST